jgi:phosphate-selective porin OprO and OprP
MRKWRWAATLVTLGLVGTGARAQVTGQPSVVPGQPTFPYILPPAPDVAPIPAVAPAQSTVPAPVSGSGLSAMTLSPTGQPIAIPVAQQPQPPIPIVQQQRPIPIVQQQQPVPIVLQQQPIPIIQQRLMVPAPMPIGGALPNQASTFADMSRSVITPVQGTAMQPVIGAPITNPPMIAAPVPMAHMPRSVVGIAPMGVTSGSTVGTALPTPFTTAIVDPQSTIVGQTDAKPASDPNSPTLTAKWNNGLNFVTDNKDWVIHVGGRLQFEPVFWSQPTTLKGSPPGNGGIPAATDASGAGVGVLDDGMFFRRVRLRSDGTGYGSVEYSLEVDFEQLNLITYDSLWVGFKDVPFLGTVRIGQHKVPQGMEMVGSDYHLTFLERSSMADAFWTLFAPGIFVSNDYFDHNLVVQTMFHRIQPVQFYNSDWGDGDYASTSRVTYTPIYEDDGAIVVHVGGSYQWRHADLGRTIQPGGTGNAIADNLHDVRFRARPELRDATGVGNIGSGVLGADTGRFIDTGFLVANSVSTWSPEFMVIYGPWSIQAEAACAQVQDARSIYPTSARGTDRGNPMFWGAYVQTSYFLTGEHRGYDRRMATFDRPKVANNFNPKNFSEVEGADGTSCNNPAGWGAWEVGYRFSYIDLNDNGIYGGQMRQHTLGVNWYFNDNFKLQANYLLINRGVPQPAVRGTVHGFGMLAQWYF